MKDVKSELTMGQNRLDAPMLSSVENDLLLNLDESGMVDDFYCNS